MRIKTPKKLKKQRRQRLNKCDKEVGCYECNEWFYMEQIRHRMQTTDSQRQVKKQTVQTNTASFDEILFSKHASKRLETRQIDMSADQKERLLEATCKAKAKGMKESLVMVDDFAFIVNVKNNLVITAVNDTKNAVFTNIDGAIIN